MSAQPQYAAGLEPEPWTPGGVTTLGPDYRLVEDLRQWVDGLPLTAGLPSLWTVDEILKGRDRRGTLAIHYNGEHRQSWSVYARQVITDRNLSVAGYGSLSSALTACLDMAREYDAGDLLFAALPGLA